MSSADPEILTCLTCSRPNCHSGGSPTCPWGLPYWERERNRHYHANYRETHLEKRREQARSYHRRNRQRQAAYRARNRDRINAHKRAVRAQKRARAIQATP
jgi:hypothetical protein